MTINCAPTDVHANRDVIRATLSTRSVEAMFGVTLETFRHAVTGAVQIGWLECLVHTCSHDWVTMPAFPQAV